MAATRDAVDTYIQVRTRFLRAARHYTHTFDRFADDNCTDIDMALAESELDKAVKALFDAANRALAPPVPGSGER